MATSEHIAAVAEVIEQTMNMGGPLRRIFGAEIGEATEVLLRQEATIAAQALLDSTEPAVHTAMLDALVRAGVLATMWAAVNEAGGCIVRATRREAENDLARMCNQTLNIDEPPPPAPVGIRRRYVTEWTADA